MCHITDFTNHTLEILIANCESGYVLFIYYSDCFTQFTFILLNNVCGNYQKDRVLYTPYRTL